MTFDEFHNALRLINSIDSHELDDPDWWPKFAADPAKFFVRCDDHSAAVIWAAMKKRLKPKLGHRYTVGRQPCADFLRGDADIMALGEGNRMNCHQCPTCYGNRASCDNCHSDHHDNGWETCKSGAYEDAEPLTPPRGRTL